MYPAPILSPVCFGPKCASCDSSMHMPRQHFMQPCMGHITLGMCLMCVHALELQKLNTNPILRMESECLALQVCAVVFLHLFILLQLSILLTRNPSFFWRFGKKTAPPPSLFLLLPVVVLTTAATFVAVYWPADVQPDGGRGEFEGCGEP